MATDERKAYPLLPVKGWWALRRRFRSSIPATVTPTYLATALGIGALGAKKNVMPALRRIGLIGEDNKPTPMANDWRDDAKYAEVCTRILTEVYPQEIRDLAPSGSNERDEVQGWFANHTAAGTSAARKMATFYLMLLQADPAAETSAPASKGASPSKVKSATVPASRPKVQPRPDVKQQPEQILASQEPASARSAAPAIHLNIQIHLSPDATAEQIDSIFASMAKHIKGM